MNLITVKCRDRLWKDNHINMYNDIYPYLWHKRRTIITNNK